MVPESKGQMAPSRENGGVATVAQISTRIHVHGGRGRRRVQSSFQQQQRQFYHGQFFIDGCRIAGPFRSLVVVDFRSGYGLSSGGGCRCCRRRCFVSVPGSSGVLFDESFVESFDGPTPAAVASPPADSVATFQRIVGHRRFTRIAIPAGGCQTFIV